MPEYIRLKHQSALTSTIWMTIGAVAFFFMPFINGIVAGAAGGWRAGRYSRALEAAAAATLASGGFFFFLWHVFELSPTYFYYGLGLLGWLALTAVGLVIGALSGVYARSETFVTQKLRPRFARASRARAYQEGPPVTGAPTHPRDEPL